MTVLIVENSLYTTAAERQQWLNDPQSVCDAFVFNFLGILGLYKISTKRGRMKTYPKENKNVRINSISEEENDMAICIQFMNELGAITNDKANMMTKLLAKMREGGFDVDDAPIRELVKDVKLSKAKPSPKLRVIFNAFVEGNITLEQVAKALQPFTRQKDLKTSAGEFKELAKSYRPILKNDIAEPTFTAATSAATATSGPQQKAQQTDTQDAKDVKPSESAEDQKQDYSKPSEPKQFYLTTKNMYRKDIRSYAKTLGLSKVGEIQSYLETNVMPLLKDPTDSTVWPLPYEWKEKLGSFLKKDQQILTYKNNIKYLMLTGAEYDSKVAQELFSYSAPRRTKLIRFMGNEGDFFKKNAITTDQLANYFIWRNALEQNDYQVAEIRADGHISAQAWKNPFEYFSKAVELKDTYRAAANDMMRVGMRGLNMHATRAFHYFLNRGEVDHSKRKIVVNKIDYQEHEKNLKSNPDYQDDNRLQAILDMVEVSQLEGGSVYDMANQMNNMALAFNFDYTDAVIGVAVRGQSRDIKKLMSTLREDFPDIQLHVSDFQKANGFEDPSPGTEAAKFFIKLLITINNYSQEETLPSHIYSELDALASQIQFKDYAIPLIIRYISRLSLQRINLMKYIGVDKFKEEFIKIATGESPLPVRRYDVAEMFDIFPNAERGNIAYSFFDAYLKHNVEELTSIYEFRIPEPSRGKGRGHLVGIRAMSQEQIVDINQRLIAHLVDNSGFSDDQKMQALLSFNYTFTSFIKDAYQVVVAPMIVERYGMDNVIESLKDINTGGVVPDRLLEYLVQEGSRGKIVEAVKTWIEEIPKTGDAQRQNRVSLMGNIKLIAKKMDNPTTEESQVFMDYIKMLEERYNGDPSLLRREIYGMPIQMFLDTGNGEQISSLAIGDIDRAARREEFLSGARGFLQDVSHSLGSFDKESARQIMTKLAESSTATRKRQYRSDAINLLGKMFFSARDSGYTDILDEAHASIKGKNKEHVENRVVSGIAVSKIKPAITGDDTPVKPQMELDDDGIMKLLDYNNINIQEVLGNANLKKKKKISEKIEAVEQAKSVDFQNLAIEEDDSIEDVERWSAEYFTLYQARKHGRIAADFKRAFKVNIPKQVEGTTEFKKKYPDSQIIEPSFHGTGSVAASMILRFGFATVSERDNGPVKVTGKMLGEGIYVTTKIDKALQYVGDSGFGRGVGTTGYILECETVLGEKGVTYAAAGEGGDAIRSPEWAVRMPNKQVRIKRAYEVEVVDQNVMEERAKSYGLLNEDRSMNISNFKYFLTEARQREEGMTEYIFHDGLIPLPNGDTAEIDELDRSKLKKGVVVEPSAKGPLIAVPGESRICHVAVAARFKDMKKEYKAFQKAVFK